MAAATSLDFSTTHWSVVLSAGKESSARARQALETLCLRYWFPLYAFVRRAGHDVSDAQDLTQEFFTRLLEKDWLLDVDPQRGKFRSFLLSAMRHFLANARDYQRAKKRGGGQCPVSLDFADAERRYQNEPADPWTPEKLYCRQWTLQLLASVLRRLESECAAAGKSDFFECVKGFLDGTDSRPHAETAAIVGMTEGALKTAVHRLRQRYRSLLREEIAQTVTEPEQIDAEIQQLFQALQADS